MLVTQRSTDTGWNSPTGPFFAPDGQPAQSTAPGTGAVEAVLVGTGEAAGPWLPGAAEAAGGEDGEDEEDEEVPALPGAPPLVLAPAPAAGDEEAAEDEAAAHPAARNAMPVRAATGSAARVRRLAMLFLDMLSLFPVDATGLLRTPPTRRCAKATSLSPGHGCANRYEPCAAHLLFRPPQRAH
jgi:hypothetical protein